MTTDEMRGALADLYPGPNWRLKCQTMPERQVVAIYQNLEKKGKLNKKKEKKMEPGIFDAIQLSIYDLDPSLFFSVK